VAEGAPPPRISVVVCAHDRRADLVQALDSLESQTLAPEGFEVVVVDNASTDGSAEAVESRAATFPAPLRLVREPRLGVAHARNAGIAAARGAVVAFLDSDAVAEPSWLAGLLAAFDDPGVACAGGPVRLRFLAPPPRGLPEVDQLRLSACDQGPQPRDIRPPGWVCGANIAFRREVLARLGGFRTELGRVGGRPTSGEETELCLRLTGAGGRIRWAPEAIVHHCIRPERLRLVAILRRAYWEGFSYGQIRAWHRDAGGQDDAVRRQLAGLEAECRRPPLLRRQAILAAILAQRLRGQLDGYAAATAPDSGATAWRESRRRFAFVRDVRRRSPAAWAGRLLGRCRRALSGRSASRASGGDARGRSDRGPA
jgi:GT2 family glycosyltransferase